MHIILLGAPGSGKGTQADLLAKKLQIPHISTGDLLRNNPNLPQHLQDKMAQGHLLEDKEILSLVEKRLSHKDAQRGWILDGFPRKLSQAQALEEKFPNLPIKAIYLKVSDEAIKERLTNRRTCKQCGHIYNLKYDSPKQLDECDVCGGPLTLRADDHPEVIEKRLQAYHELTSPVIEYYKKHNQLITIDCSEDLAINEVFDQLSNTLS